MTSLKVKAGGAVGSLDKLSTCILQQFCDMKSTTFGHSIGVQNHGLDGLDARQSGGMDDYRYFHVG